MSADWKQIVSSAAGARLPLGSAATLPASAYTDPGLYEVESERLFAGQWLCAGRVEQVAEPGDYVTLDLLGDALVVVRGKDGTVRVLSRACRHRGAEVVNGTGNARSFQCPYHAWTYGLDGALIGAPHMDEAEGFDKASCALPEIRSEVWEGWIFVNFDGAAEPLGPQLAPLADLLQGYEMSSHIALDVATFDSPFNWKVLVDNFMEAYHHIAIHRQTLEPVMPGADSWTPDNEGPYSVLVMPAKEDDSDAESVYLAGDNGLVAAVVYPFHLFAPGPHGVAWYQLLPEAHDRFTLKIFMCHRPEIVNDPAQRETVEGGHALVTHIHHEDIAACEGTWAGLNARSYTQGRLAPLEKPLWQFNQWWLDRMTALD